MATLTESAKVSRIGINITIGGLLVLMIGRMVVGGLISWWKATHPEIPEPTVGFGVIPPIEFPVDDRPTLTYRLETISGGFPQFPIQADVLQIPVLRPNLLAMERSVQDASNLGFKVVPEKISDLTYMWKVTTPFPMTLTMQIYEGRFVWETDWSQDPNFLVQKSLPNQTQAVKESKDIIRKLGDSAQDLTEDVAKLSYLKGLGGDFLPATSLSDADFVQVDLFRKKYNDEFPFVTSDPKKGVVQVILSGNPRVGRIVEVDYNYFSIDYSRIETYPLKPVEQAWQELLDGKGYVASIDKGVSDVVVRRVEIAYYDSYELQKYAQPVYMFTGDNNFVAYVQAVRDPKNPGVVTEN